jgi:zinc transport system ATP-binding protein
MTPPDVPTDAASSILDVEDLAIRFGETEVFRGLTFSVRRGSSVAVIGPNGCGKTALFKALVGALPHDGKIRWADGVRIGYVPQKIDIARDLPLTGRDLLVAKGAATGDRDDPTAALRRVGIEDAAKTPIGALSGGQFQRLLLAVALVGRPDVLLLDEPTAGIDVPGQVQIDDLVRRVQEERGLTVMLISHDLTVVYRHADAVLCLSREHASFGPPRKILTPTLLTELYGAGAEYHVHGH